MGKVNTIKSSYVFKESGYWVHGKMNSTFVTEVVTMSNQNKPTSKYCMIADKVLREAKQQYHNKAMLHARKAAVTGLTAQNKRI
jgi:hypothetical protein